MIHIVQRFTRVSVGLALVLTLFTNPSPAIAASGKLENIARHPHGAPEGSSLESIRNSIIQGATEAGWHMVSTAPGEVTVSILVRAKHEATVAIRFDERTFQIDYVDSTNLDYRPDGLTRTVGKERKHLPGPRIHKNYNKWVHSLAKRVEMRIAQPLPSLATDPRPGPPLIADELEKLDALRRKGILSDEEFETQKKKLLAN
jgi:hypothetical protein